MNKILVSLLLFFSFAFTSEARDNDSIPVAGVDNALIEALRLGVLGKTDAQKTILDSCEKLYPNNSVIKYELSSIYFNRGIINNALKKALAADSLDNNNEWYKFRIAQIYIKEGKYNLAADYYRDITKLEPNNEEYYLDASQLYSIAKDYPNAIEMLNEYENKFGTSKTILGQKLNYLSEYENIDYKRASSILLEEAEKSYNFDSTDPHIVVLLAEAYRKIGLIKKENNLLKKYCKENGENGIVDFYEADKYLQSKDIENFQKKVFSALGDNNLDSDYKNFYVSNLLYKYKQMSDTSDIYNDYKNSLGSILKKFKDTDYKGGGLIYCDWLKLTNDSLYIPELKLLLGKESNNTMNSEYYYLYEDILFFHYRNSEYDSLAYYSQICIDNFPEQPMSYFFKVIPIFYNENYSEAIPILEDGIKFAPEYSNILAEFYSLLGTSFYNIDNKLKAYYFYDKSLEINKNDYTLMNDYAYYLALDNIRLDEAEKMSYKALYSDLNNPAFLDTYAWILYKKGDLTNAKNYLKKALEKSTEDNVSWVYYDHFGDILKALEEKDAAVQCWQKALLFKDSDKESLIFKIGNINK